MRKVKTSLLPFLFYNGLSINKGISDINKNTINMDRFNDNYRAFYKIEAISFITEATFAPVAVVRYSDDIFINVKITATDMVDNKNEVGDKIDKQIKDHHIKFRRDKINKILHKIRESC